MVVDAEAEVGEQPTAGGLSVHLGSALLALQQDLLCLSRSRVLSRCRLQSRGHCANAIGKACRTCRHGLPTADHRRSPRVARHWHLGLHLREANLRHALRCHLRAPKTHLLGPAHRIGLDLHSHHRCFDTGLHRVVVVLRVRPHGPALPGGGVDHRADELSAARLRPIGLRRCRRTVRRRGDASWRHTLRRCCSWAVLPYGAVGISKQAASALGPSLCCEQQCGGGEQDGQAQGRGAVRSPMANSLVSGLHMAQLAYCSTGALVAWLAAAGAGGALA